MAETIKTEKRDPTDDRADTSDSRNPYPLFSIAIDPYAMNYQTVWYNPMALGQCTRGVKPPRELRKRNLSIVRDLLNGATLKDAAVLNGLSAERARQIAMRFCQRTMPSVKWYTDFDSLRRRYRGWLIRAVRAHDR